MIRIILFLNCIILSSFLYSQSEDADGIHVFEDGTDVTITELNTDPKDFPKHELYIGGYINEGVVGFGGYAYTIPKKIQITSLIGGNGGVLDVTFALKSYVKKIDQALTVKSKDMGKTAPEYIDKPVTYKYKTKLPTNRVRSFGVTARIAYFSLNSSDEALIPSYYDFDVLSITTGISVVKTKNIRYLMDDKFKRRKAVTSRWFVGVNYIQPFDGGTLVDGQVNKFVARFAYDFSISITPSGRGGLRGLIGYQTRIGLMEDVNGIFGGIGYRYIIG